MKRTALEEQVWSVLTAPPTPPSLAGLTARKAMQDAQSIKPADVRDFCKRHNLPLMRVAELAGTTRANLYLWAGTGGANVRTIERVQQALIVALGEQELAPRQRALVAQPDVARDLRRVCELAVGAGVLSERRAAEILGLDVEMWNALPPTSNNGADA